MLATLVEAPFHRAGWVYEEKYDGIRAIAYKEGARVTLLSRNLKDRTADFPGVVAAVAALPAPTLALDGEIVVFDAARVSRFRLLHGAAEPAFIAFDCLYARGEDLRSRPLAERRARLEREVRPGAALRLARRMDANGLTAFAEARARGLEGIVAKDAASPYEAGVRARSWLKVKVRAEEDFVIGGFTAPSGSRSHFGALLIGAWDGDRLRYAGKVGTGFDGRMLGTLMARFRPLLRETPPFADAPRERGVSWLEPRLVAQVGFTEWTGDGRLRHPTFLGLRDDKDARDVSWSGADGPPA
jgi:bifunctional non-homologous end joining protein LigD